VEIVEADKARQNKDYRDLPKPKDSPHLWQGRLAGLQPGTHLLEVRTVDMHGREHWGRRVFRVESTTPKSE
jgi:hypothetical protein